MICIYCCRGPFSAKMFGVTFHVFPADEELKNLWFEACASHKCRVVFGKSSRMWLCSDHFTPNDFDFGINKKLEKGVVPTRFSKKPYIHCVACHEIHDVHSDVSFHKFPEAKDMRKMWREACVNNGIAISRAVTENSICSNHFPRDKWEEVYKIGCGTHVIFFYKKLGNI